MKLTFFLALLLLISIRAHADTFIPYDGGKLVLFALPNCGGPDEPQDRMFGIWQKKGAVGKSFCWSYNGVISIYYIDGKVLTLPAEDVVVENDGTVDDQDPTYENRSQFPARLSDNN